MSAPFDGKQYSTTLGLQNVTEEQYEMLAKFRDHTYVIAPPSGTHSRGAQERVERVLGGSLDPTLTVEQLERLREHIQITEKREQQKLFQSLSQIWMERLAINFRKERRVNHAEIERMFYPTYAPPYVDAVRALDLPVRRWWKQELFASLEHLARLPLDRVDMDTGAMKLTFEEWYSLHWNFYMPFNPVAYVCACTSASCIYTREFVDELAAYCKERLEKVYIPAAAGPGAARPAPILMLGRHLGKLAWLLNETKVLPVPVIASHEKPATNPYLLRIPQHKQKEFAVRPIQTMTDADALEKYKPALVLLSSLKANVDITSTVRRFGSVKEYCTIGISDSYTEGHGWDTFGHPHFRDRQDKSTTAAFVADGFVRMSLPHCSRWLLHKHDSRDAFGLGSVQSFVRQSYVWDIPTRLNFRFFSRLRPRFY